MKKIGKRERKLLNILDTLAPDFIFVTGDFISWKGDCAPALTFLSKLKAKIGAWAVLGDYDYSNSRRSCLFCHQEGSGKETRHHRVRMLRNDMEKINLDEGPVWIGGIDLEGGAAFLSKKKNLFWKEKAPAIILSHNPVNFELVDEDQYVLMLSGDTHGGQIPLPSWLWRILGYTKNARYNHGFFEEGRKKLFVSNGIGTSHIPIRLFRRPEVVVLHF
jgi:predicted MPP superfamily phosphohydrolase